MTVNHFTFLSRVRVNSVVEPREFKRQAFLTLSVSC